jgi:hypothetical protein
MMTMAAALAGFAEDAGEPRSANGIDPLAGRTEYGRQRLARHRLRVRGAQLIRINPERTLRKW